MKLKNLSLILLTLFACSFAYAQNVLIEPSGITPIQGAGSLWTINSGDIKYSTGKVNIGNAANSDRFNIRSSEGENALRVQVGGSTKLRVYSNGAVALNSPWTSPVANATRIGGKAIVSGKLNVGSDNSVDEPGDIRWNVTSQDFEGFDGTAWVSLTRGYTSSGSANTGPPTTPMATEQQIVPPSTGTETFFGKKMSISGDFAIIADDDIIYFYKYNGTNWVFHSSPTLSNGSGGIYGIDVAIDGNFAVVGHPINDEAYILKYNGSLDTWNEETIINPSDFNSSNTFGYSVGISDSTVIVGMRGRDAYGQTSAGGAYVFLRSGGIWTEQAILQHPDFETQDTWGHEVTISNSNAFVGSLYEDSVYVFQKSGSVWGFTQVLTATGTLAFGQSVSIYGDFAVIGDPSQGTSSKGAAYVFYNNNGTWIESQKLAPSVDHGSYPYFGYSVDIAGDYIIIGEASFSSQGWAYIFHYDGSDWNETRVIEDPLGQGGGFGNNDRFGKSVSIDSANWVAGAPDADSNGYVNQGKVIFGPVE